MLLTWTADGRPLVEGFHRYALPSARTCLLWTRGYFFDAGGRMRVDGEIDAWLVNRLPVTPLADLVPAMNGCFSIVVVWEDAKVIEVGVDRFGTIPIYYCLSDASLAVSDDYWQVADNVPSAQYDPDAVVSMVLLGYVVGHRTLLKHVLEFPQAATHTLSSVDGVFSLVTSRYWRLSYQDTRRQEREAWRNELSRLFDSVFSRYTHGATHHGWDVRIPLSGGKDSRLLAAMFSFKGASVQTFSYGPPGNAETECAAQVARVLGIPFCFVPVAAPSSLAPPLPQQMTKRVGMRARFTAGLGAQLSLTGLSESHVCVPGYSANVLSGGTVSRGALLVHSRAQAASLIIGGHSLPVLHGMAKTIFPDIWDDQIKERVVLGQWHFDAADPVGSIDRWNCENRQRRLTLSELRTYEEFGHWMLPFYDYELYDFYASVPLDLRYRGRLYIDVLLHAVFTGRLARLAEIPVAYAGQLRLPVLDWRDRLCLRLPRTLGAWVLERAQVSKRAEHLRSVGVYAPDPSGPDPLDYWWYSYPSFRESVVRTLRNWDGMGGIIDVSALVDLLQRPLPRLFIQFTVPALLTLYYLQELRSAT
jgi:hypothetical protein